MVNFTWVYLLEIFDKCALKSWRINKEIKTQMHTFMCIFLEFDANKGTSIDRVCQDVNHRKCT